MVPKLAAGALALVLGSLGALHVWWALRGLRDLPGRSGGGVAVPSVDGKPLFRPTRGLTLLVAAALFAGAALGVASLVQLAAARRDGRLALGVALLALVFFARFVGDFRYVGLFRRVRGTAFARWDAWLFAPLCLAIAAAGTVVARALWPR